MACKTEQDLQDGDQTEAIYVQHFAHKSPLYSSVNVPSRVGAAELVDAVERGGKQSKSIAIPSFRFWFLLNGYMFRFKSRLVLVTQPP